MNLNLILTCLCLVYGPLRLLTFTKLFNYRINGFFQTLFSFLFEKTPQIILYLDSLVFVFCLAFSFYNLLNFVN